MNPRNAKRQSILISRISDMEDNPASVPMVSALSGRIEALMREMGLTATVTIGGQRNESRGLRGASRRTLVRRRKRMGNIPAAVHPPGG